MSGRWREACASEVFVLLELSSCLCVAGPSRGCRSASSWASPSSSALGSSICSTACQSSHLQRRTPHSSSPFWTSECTSERCLTRCMRLHATARCRRAPSVVLPQITSGSASLLRSSHGANLACYGYGTMMWCIARDGTQKLKRRTKVQLEDRCTGHSGHRHRRVRSRVGGRVGWCAAAGRRARGGHGSVPCRDPTRVQ